ncbi:MAG TPA: hypothetical protein VG756_08405 [Pseudonocardiaceae bacterium]|jgi:hypothetical protein|nr:hypothetical protein [Pseudonocardiaceae bacterium]
MTGEHHAKGPLDTNVVVLRRFVDPAELPDEMAITAITLAELSAGPHEVRGNDEQDGYAEHAERARRLEVLQRVENEFDPIPFVAEAPHLQAGGRGGRRIGPQAAWSHRGPDDRVNRHCRGIAFVHNESEGFR